MTHSRTATPPAQWPPHIRARYGVGPRRWWVPVALVGLGLLFATAVAVMGWRIATPALAAGVHSYDTLSDTQMEITIDLERREAVPANCVLRARASDGFDVGYQVVTLPPATGRTRHTWVLPTAYRALVGELLGCASQGLPPGVVGGQFRPGVLPPGQ